MSELQRALDRIAELEDLLGLRPDHLWWFDATPTSKRLLGLLLARELVTRPGAFSALYGDRPDCDQPSIKIIDAHMHRLRVRLAKPDLGLRIENVFGSGWALSAAAKAKLNDMAQQREAA